MVVFPYQSTVTSAENPIVQIVEIEFRRVDGKHSLKNDHKFESSIGILKKMSYPSAHIHSFQFRQLAHTVFVLVGSRVRIVSLILQEFFFIDLDIEIARHEKRVIIDIFMDGVHHRLQFASAVVYAFGWILKIGQLKFLYRPFQS